MDKSCVHHVNYNGKGSGGNDSIISLQENVNQGSLDRTFSVMENLSERFTKTKRIKVQGTR